MYKRVMWLEPLAVFLLAVNTCGAKLRLAFACGGCGPLQDGWFAITSCGTYTDIDNTDIDVTIAVGDGGQCAEAQRCLWHV
jgi:hypothetical protein